MGMDTQASSYGLRKRNHCVTYEIASEEDDDDCYLVSNSKKTKVEQSSKRSRRSIDPTNSLKNKPEAKNKMNQHKGKDVAKLLTVVNKVPILCKTNTKRKLWEPDFSMDALAVRKRMFEHYLTLLGGEVKNGATYDEMVTALCDVESRGVNACLTSHSVTRLLCAINYANSTAKAYRTAHAEPKSVSESLSKLGSNKLATASNVSASYVRDNTLKVENANAIVQQVGAKRESDADDVPRKVTPIISKQKLKAYITKQSTLQAHEAKQSNSATAVQANNVNHSENQYRSPCKIQSGQYVVANVAQTHSSSTMDELSRRVIPPKRTNQSTSGVTCDWKDQEASVEHNSASEQTARVRLPESNHAGNREIHESNNRVLFDVTPGPNTHKPHTVIVSMPAQMPSKMLDIVRQQKTSRSTCKVSVQKKNDVPPDINGTLEQRLRVAPKPILCEERTSLLKKNGSMNSNGKGLSEALSKSEFIVQRCLSPVYDEQCHLPVTSSSRKYAPMNKALSFGSNQPLSSPVLSLAAAYGTNHLPITTDQLTSATRKSSVSSGKRSTAKKRTEVQPDAVKMNIKANQPAPSHATLPPAKELREWLVQMIDELDKEQPRNIQSRQAGGSSLYNTQQQSMSQNKTHVFVRSAGKNARLVVDRSIYNSIKYDIPKIVQRLKSQNPVIKPHEIFKNIEHFAACELNKRMNSTKL